MQMQHKKARQGGPRNRLPTEVAHRDDLWVRKFSNYFWIVQGVDSYKSGSEHLIAGKIAVNERYVVDFCYFCET
jgi:hypothetical protein